MGIQYGLGVLIAAGLIWFFRDERIRSTETLRLERERGAEMLLLSKASEAALRSQISVLHDQIDKLQAELKEADAILIKALAEAKAQAQEAAYRPGGGVALDAFEAALEREGLSRLGKWAVESVDGGEEFVLLPKREGVKDAR